MDENEEVSGAIEENKRHSLRRVSSRSSVISAAEFSPRTLRRNNSKK